MLLSVYIHSVSTCFQSNICKWNKLAKIQKKIWMYIHMIKTQTAHRQFQSFVVTYLFEFILSYFFHSESPLSFILCYMSAKFVRLCRIYRIGDTCFCCLCPCITTCFWYLILWSLKCEKENKNGKYSPLLFWYKNYQFYPTHRIIVYRWDKAVVQKQICNSCVDDELVCFKSSSTQSLL